MSQEIELTPNELTVFVKDGQCKRMQINADKDCVAFSIEACSSNSGWNKVGTVSIHDSFNLDELIKSLQRIKTYMDDQMYFDLVQDLIYEEE